MWSLFRFRRYHPFDISEVPTLDLSQGSAGVDIGFLGGDEHAAAFASIFAKVIHDSCGSFVGFTLSGLQARRSLVTPPPSLCPPVPFTVLEERALEAASALYLSGNEEVRLDFTNGQSSQSLFVTFDNPHFVLQGRGK